MTVSANPYALILIAGLLAACGTLEIGIEPMASPSATALTVNLSTSAPTVSRQPALPTLPPTAATGATLAGDTPSTATATMPATNTPLPPTLTSTPTRRPRATATAFASPATITPEPAPTNTLVHVITFTVAPTTFTPGDRLTFTWEAVGVEARICPVSYGRVLTDQCFAVPLRGSRILTTDQSAVGYSAFELSVTGPKGEDGAQRVDIRLVDVRADCRGFWDWFFDNPPNRCPSGLPLNSYAAAERFERGRMIWVQALDEYYAFFDEAGPAPFKLFGRPLSFKPGASLDNRLGAPPPPGLYEPVSGFGLLWRGEVDGAEDLRERLGWAVEPESGFDTLVQCETPGPTPDWSCYLRTPEGKIIHYYHWTNVGLFWEEQ